MERRVEEQRGGGGGDGRKFGVRRGGISGERLDLRSSFGLCYCGYIEGTLFTFLFRLSCKNTNAKFSIIITFTFI